MTQCVESYNSDNAQLNISFGNGSVVMHEDIPKTLIITIGFATKNLSSFSLQNYSNKLAVVTDVNLQNVMILKLSPLCSAQ